MPTAKLNGVELYYETYGKGEPLILIAGLASDSQSWLPIIETLAGHYQLILFDNRGVGRTILNDSEIDIQSIADDAVSLAKHLELSKFNLLGHSMGGFVAMNLAARYPDMVGKLILAATAASSGNRNNLLFNDFSHFLKNGMEMKSWFRNLFYWIFSQRLFEDKTLLETYIKLAVDYPYPQSCESFESQVRAIERFNGEPILVDINAETLIICGQEDLLFSPEQSIQQLKLLPNARSCVIENAAHSIHMDNPVAFSDCVLKFLN